MFYQHTVDNLDNRGVGEVGVAPAFEHAGTAGLEAEREDIEGHVGTRLVDNSYHAERYRHLANGHAVGALPLGEHPSQRRGQTGHAAHVRGDVGQSLPGQLQTVILGVVLVHEGKVAGILRQDVFGPGIGCIGDIEQYGIDALLIEQVEPARSHPHLFETGKKCRHIIAILCKCSKKRRHKGLFRFVFSE